MKYYLLLLLKLWGERESTCASVDPFALLCLPAHSSSLITCIMSDIKGLLQGSFSWQSSPNSISFAIWSYLNCVSFPDLCHLWLHLLITCSLKKNTYKYDEIFMRAICISMHRGRQTMSAWAWNQNISLFFKRSLINCRTMKNSIGHPVLGMQLSKNIWETEFLFRKKILWGARLLLLPSFTIIKTFRYSVWTRYGPKWVNLHTETSLYTCITSFSKYKHVLLSKMA
jgi:hypothetical protein